MSTNLDEELQMLADTVARYVANRSDGKANSEDGWKELAELGWLYLPYPEEVGGLGLGTAGVSAVMQGHGRGLLATPYLPFAVMAGGMLARCPRASQALAAVMEGTQRVAAAFAVGAAPTLVAQAADDGWRLAGRCNHVLADDEADAVLALARIGASDETGLFMVRTDAPGVTVELHFLPDGRRAGCVGFDNVAVAASDRLDENGGVETLLREVEAETLLAAAADNLGAMQVLYEQTLDYAKLRKQFGRPIGSFQSLQFRLVDMWIKLDEVRSLVASAAAAPDRQEAGALAVAAWIQSIWSGRLIGEEAIQIHGAIAMTDEHAVGRYVKRILVNELVFGAPERHFSRYRSMR
ncbi:MAG: acyl-CoA dehydrogenase family protein [Nitratireductor sp.]